MPISKTRQEFDLRDWAEGSNSFNIWNIFLASCLKWIQNSEMNASLTWTQQANTCFKWMAKLD